LHDSPTKKPHPATGHRGRFGGDGRLTGYLERDVTAYIWSRVRGCPGPMPEAPAYPVVLRMREVQRRLGLSRPTIKKLEKTGVLTAVLLSGEEAAD
jgi:hypothetical protein